MATTWIYQQGPEAEPGGPARFRELVQLVRSEALHADHLVKADWEDVWRPAATVVGLFKMAGREDVLARWEAERAAAEEAAARLAIGSPTIKTLEVEPKDELSTGSLSFATADDLDRLLAGVSERVPGTGDARGTAEGLIGVGQDMQLPDESLAISDVSPSEPSHIEALRPGRLSSDAFSPLSSGPSRMLEAIESAVSDAETKEAQRTKTSRWTRIRSLELSGLGSGALRWGGILLFANLTAVVILSWSELQTQRFPEGAGGGGQSEIFPFWGPCSSREYAFLLIDIVILAGFCGYLTARYIEARADAAPSV